MFASSSTWIILIHTFSTLPATGVILFPSSNITAYTCFLMVLFFYCSCLFIKTKVLFTTGGSGSFFYRSCHLFFPGEFFTSSHTDQSIEYRKRALFWIHCSKMVSGLFTALIPVYCIWKIKDSKKNSLLRSRAFGQYQTIPVTGGLHDSINYTRRNTGRF